MSHEPPDLLRRKIAGDLRPVRPLLAPWQRAAIVVPALALASAAGPGLLGFRDDLTRVGPLLAWGASFAQFGLAVALVVAAFREAAPAELLPRSLSLTALAVAGLTSAAVGWSTSVVSPELVPRAETIASWQFCWGGILALGAPVLALLAVLLSRGLPFRPGLAGALAGLGAGLAVDGGWRLYCNYSQSLHVFASHAGAVLTLTLLGLLLGLAGSRWNRRRSRL